MITLARRLRDAAFVHTPFVIPAKAGIQLQPRNSAQTADMMPVGRPELDSCVRRNDERVLFSGKVKRRVVAGLASIILILPLSAALADTPAAPAPTVAIPVVALADKADSAPDPERLALARQIIAIVLPSNRAMGIMDTMTDSIMRPMEAQIHSQIGTDDAGLNAIFKDFIQTIPGTVRATIEPMMPDMIEAMAQAYTHTFTRDELTQVLAFGQTPAGAKYLSRASDLVKDPAMQAFYMRLVPAIQAAQAPVLAEFKRKLAAYAAAHPDVAKKMTGTAKR